MIITVSKNAKPDNNSFQESKPAIVLLKKFPDIVQKVRISGNEGLALVYFILNRVNDSKDYIPPNIELLDDCSDNEKLTVQRILKQIERIISKRR